eukprot:TRINITY_DN73601_c0_g1_i1.p1 TRINITY_DN73601_c0_g1~~TRINITY_DN73601_c0_g1_i1.p1  ORF type:complete len:607 (+),score=52.16 TRINITY_DN73601_c0_g1_i1:28-1821(+)
MACILEDPFYFHSVGSFLHPCRVASLEQVSRGTQQASTKSGIWTSGGAIGLYMRQQCLVLDAYTRFCGGMLSLSRAIALVACELYDLAEKQYLHDDRVVNLMARLCKGFVDRAAVLRVVELLRTSSLAPSFSATRASGSLTTRKVCTTSQAVIDSMQANYVNLQEYLGAKALGKRLGDDMRGLHIIGLVGEERGTLSRYDFEEMRLGRILGDITRAVFAKHILFALTDTEDITLDTWLPNTLTYISINGLDDAQEDSTDGDDYTLGEVGGRAVAEAVIQDVVHDDRAAAADASDGLVAQLMWSTNVERNTHQLVPRGNEYDVPSPVANQLSPAGETHILRHGNVNDNLPPVADRSSPAEEAEVNPPGMHTAMPASSDKSDYLLASVARSAAIDHETCEVASASSGGRPPEVSEWTEVGSHGLLGFYAGSANWGVMQPSEYGEKIFVVKFNRCGRQLQEALHTGPQLETVRAAAKTAGHPCVLRSGASVFLYPEQYPSVLAVLNMQLRAHHVVVCEAFLPLLYSDISVIPAKQKVRPTSLKVFGIVCDETGETGEICVVERGFYNDAPRQLLRCDTVTQSTSEAAPNRVVNVRRIICD